MKIPFSNDFKSTIGAAFGLITILVPTFAIELHQSDSFDSDVAGWKIGATQGGPAIVESGRPNGADDSFLQMTSTGGSGIASRLVFFNEDQWTGDYLGAGVEAISVDLNNLGSTALEVRLLVESGASRFVSVASGSLEPGLGWVNMVYPVQRDAWSGSGDWDTAFQSVSRLRIFHGESLNFPPDPIAGSLGVDNFTAVPEVSTTVLGLGGALIVFLLRKLRKEFYTC